PLNVEYFYFSRPVFRLSNKNNGNLFVEVESHTHKNLYLSYQTMDNKFDVFPEKYFLNLNKYKIYQFKIEIESSENISIIPYIIHYNKNKKKKLTAVSNSQIINFKNDENCRLTFKIIGEGHFEINRIRIIPKG